MIGRRGPAVAFLVFVSLAGMLPGPNPIPSHRSLAHNAGFPPLDDDDTREPAIADENEEPNERLR